MPCWQSKACRSISWSRSRFRTKKSIERLASRGRPDDNLATVRERLEQFHSLTEPLAQYYEQQGILRRVDGTGSPEQVFERIKRVVELAKQPSN